MFGLRFIKFQPTMHVIRIANGRTVQEGAGLSFFYYAPTTSLVAIPLSSVETPFMFAELSCDYQTLSIQGAVTWRIKEPGTISKMMNFTLDDGGSNYASEDPQKLASRIVGIVQVQSRKHLSGLPLKEAMGSADAMVAEVGKRLSDDVEIRSLGIEILGFSVLAIRPNTETARALEAETRERILKGADDAIYSRRNSAVEQERLIRENELSTEIAVEVKKREIQDAKMEAERSLQEKKNAMKSEDLASSIGLEEKRKVLVELATANARTEADAKAYEVAASMKAFEDVAPATLQALASMGMGPQQMIAQAFQGIAERADHIGQLNISPDLLTSLLHKNS